MNDDPNMPRVLPPTDIAAPGVKVVPTCRICGTAVPDITAPDHHVCVLDDAGAVTAADGSKWTKTTRDKAHAAWQARGDAAKG